VRYRNIQGDGYVCKTRRIKDEERRSRFIERYDGDLSGNNNEHRPQINGSDSQTWCFHSIYATSLSSFLASGMSTPVSVPYSCGASKAG
jgi:hypothetical protein